MQPLPRLSDKFDIATSRQLLNGMQAIVRLVLNQKARDRAQGLNTAGYVTGYRGSPIATLETAFALAGERVAAADIVFQPAINEDLAATALWGSQQAELRGEGRFDGVFGVWYGKGPGVDRSGDALRHANHAGTSRHGGVVALMGDDHTCESSTSAHQSEFAFVDAMIPILNPAGVQELLDYGIFAFALSRFAGVWVGLKCVKDNVESTAVVEADPARVTVALPTDGDFAMPPGGLNIRLGDTPLAKEARLHNAKRAAILAFARLNGIDRLVLDGGPAPRIGLITSGKSHADTLQALDMLGIDAKRAVELGIRLYKVAMPWPLEPVGLKRFADGLDLIIVIEEKRSLIETQVKEQLYDVERRPRVIGKKDESGRWLFPAAGALDPLAIAIAVGRRIGTAEPNDALLERVRALETAQAQRPQQAEAMQRKAYFCAGCPHNTSTRVPEGQRAYAGIGCHYMVQWMDRDTEGFTQMGGEGANWIGEAPFSKRRHIYQNIGDGTFVHSGSLAIRAAIAAGVTMTYKLLYNDAVAMTGGQHLDGDMSLEQMAHQLTGEGAKRIAVVSETPERFRHGSLPAGVSVHHRRDFETVQRELAQTAGVSVLIYDQTCAAEKRRRRKRGTMAEPGFRVAINPLVCEGCGDCGVASNCVAILPRETEFGRKRTIDQSACNKDQSCIDGLCPSFVTLEGARPKLRPLADFDDALGHLPDPLPRRLERPLAVLATGVGGTGVVTSTAVLGQAAQIEGLGFGAIDVTGIAQKGGPVVCHMQFAAAPEQIHAIRVGIEGADVIIGGDLVVTAANKVLETISPGRTRLIVSRHAAPVGDFTHQPDLETPVAALLAAIQARAGGTPDDMIDAQEVAIAALGDSIYANMLLIGMAYQRGLLPLGAEAIEAAIGINGADVANNRKAFRLGRLAAHDPKQVERLIATKTSTERGRPGSDPPKTIDQTIAVRADDLRRYQDDRLASRYIEGVRRIESVAGSRIGPGTALTEAVARAYYKLLAIKDEYEVARLYTDGRFAEEIKQTFEGVTAINIHLAPPILARPDPVTGRPRKRRFGPWVMPLLRLIAKGKRLRGTPLDLFGQTAERRAERRLIGDYEADLDLIAERLSPDTLDTALALAELPLTIRGFGSVKRRAMEAASERRSKLRAGLEQPARRRLAAE